MEHLRRLPEFANSSLSRPVTEEEYARVLDFADRIGIENGYMQAGGTAAESFIPAFDGEGLA